MCSPREPSCRVVGTRRQSPPASGTGAHQRICGRGPALWTERPSIDRQEVRVILVVGATGQLGSLVVGRLRAEGQQVRAMVRDPATAEDLQATGAQLAVADLAR